MENFQPGYLNSLGLGYESLEAINPPLVMTSITDFGQTGPYRHYKGSEIVATATCTLMARHGDPDREPLKYYGNDGHYFAGNMAVVPTIGAMVYSRLTGVGQHVDVSIQEALLGAVDRGGLRYAYSGEAEQRQRATQRGASYPTGNFPCKDGYVAVLGGGSRRWPRVGRVIDIPDLMYDPRFKTDADREANLPELEALWLGWLSEHTMDEVFEKSVAERLPVAPVYTTKDLVNNRHYKERGFWVDVEHPAAGTFTYPGAPFKMSESPWQIRRPAPLMGEHNEEVFCGLLGRSKENLVTLMGQGII
jgi:crotonobetainyl-CoA:carnitine CoA-transferase CaiB-like acyl-CoA transferase